MHPNQTAMDIILGSSSTSRKQVLEEAGWTFEVQTAGIDEKAIRHDDPFELVKLLAKAKAEAILPDIADDREAILITADQVVVCMGEILEKPESEQELRHFYDCYEQDKAQIVNGIAATNTKTGKQVVEIDVSTAKLKMVPDEVLEQLLKQTHAMHCAGGLLVESSILEPCIESFNGTDDSVMGIPLGLVEEMIEQVR